MGIIHALNRPLRHYTATPLPGYLSGSDRNGAALCRYDGYAGMDRSLGIPAGYRTPYAWSLPITNGGMVSRWLLDGTSTVTATLHSVCLFATTTLSGSGSVTAQLGIAIFVGMSAHITASDTVTPETVATEVWNHQLEATYTAEDILKIIAAVTAGKATGGGTTAVTFRDLADSKDSVAMTVDAKGNRSNVTLAP